MPEGEMWQRFTNPATRVIHLAQEEAKRLGMTTIGTEHLLLGLIREGDGIAARVLERSGVSVGRVRTALAQQTTTAAGQAADSARLVLSTHGKKAVEYALQEARKLNPAFGLLDFVDTEHLLLGLLREGQEEPCLAMRLLAALQVNPAHLREDVLVYLGGMSGVNKPKYSFTADLSDLSAPGKLASAHLITDMLANLYTLAFQLALRTFEVSKAFPPEEASAFSADLRRVSRQVCTCIAGAQALLNKTDIYYRRLAEATRNIVETKVLLEFAVEYGYLAATTAGDMKEQYDRMLTDLNRIL